MRRDFSACPRCGAPTKQTTAFNGLPSEFWRECTSCNTFINTYIPQPHQMAVHKDAHTYVGNFGAFGTGKTLTSREEVLKHVLLTPNANVLIGAEIVPQYEQTIKRELEADLPAAFVKGYSTQKSYIDLVNGARIMYRPFYNADNLRSLNLTMFVMVEASEVKGEVFHQLKTRLRNLSASKQKVDGRGRPVYRIMDNGAEVPEIEVEWRKGIVESNPDSGWIRTDVLLVADSISKHGTIKDQYEQMASSIDPAVGAHVASTDTNQYLPTTFIDELTKNKPGWWVARYVFSSFSYSEGLVYPSAAKHIIPTFEIPREWKRIVAFDYGLSDDAVYLFGAIDESNGIVYIYKEVRVNNRNVQELAELFHMNTKDIPTGGWYAPPIIDPKSGTKRDYNKKTLKSLFLDYNINFKDGYVNVDARIFRTNTYFESGRLKIMDCCTGLIEELRDYKFQPKTLDKQNTPDKPIDKNNHAINPLEWICMELPDDPKRIMYGAYDMYGNDLTKPVSKTYLPYALTEDTNKLYTIDTAYNIELF